MNCQLFIIPVKVIFGYENPYIFPNVILVQYKSSVLWYKFIGTVRRWWCRTNRWAGSFRTIEILFCLYFLCGGWIINLRVACWSKYNFACVFIRQILFCVGVVWLKQLGMHKNLSIRVKHLGIFKHLSIFTYNWDTYIIQVYDTNIVKMNKFKTFNSYTIWLKSC